MGAPQAREFSLFPPWGLPKLGNFHFSPPWGLPKLGNFHFSPPWGLPKLGNFHFPPVGAPQAREFSLFLPVGASQAREFSLFPPWTASKLWNFHFSSLGGSPSCEFQIARQRRLDSPQIPCSLNVFPCFCNGFLQSTVLYTFVAIKPVENIMFDNASNSLSPQPLKIPLFTVFSSIFPCSNAGSQLNIYIRNPSKTLFLTVFFQCFQSNRR